MNILLYVPYVDKSFGGVLQYSKCLLTILQQDKKNNYYLFLRNNFEEFEEFRNEANFTVLEAKETYYRTSLFNIFELFIFNFLAFLEKYKVFIPISRPNVLDKVIQKYKIDVLHSPYQHLPEVKIPTIVTMHDLQELHFPDFFTPEVRAKRAIEYLYNIQHATKIVVSYSHVKQDIIRYFNTTEDKTEVVLLNMQNLWFEKFNKNQHAIESSITFPENFILYPAATWRHKNHINLLKAIRLLKEKNGVIIPLVCTGNQTDYYTTLKGIIAELGIEEQILFLGKISEEDLYYAYKKCKAIVIPTLYEAGSFPLMEGILMGIPCICSNVTSLPETLNNSAYIFDPNNIEEMADKILRITSDDSYINEELDHFKNLLKNLTNGHSLEAFLSIYNNINRQNHHL